MGAVVKVAADVVEVALVLPLAGVLTSGGAGEFAFLWIVGQSRRRRGHGREDP